MTHLGYIIAAYAATAIVLIATAAWVTLDLRVQKEKLRRLEEQGLRRGSGASR
jgi:heme exporter protein D